MGDPPDYTGRVETFEDANIGRGALWKNEDEGENLLKFMGRVSFYNGKKKFKISVWSNREEDEEDKKNRNTIPAFADG